MTTAVYDFTVFMVNIVIMVIFRYFFRMEQYHIRFKWFNSDKIINSTVFIILDDHYLV